MSINKKIEEAIENAFALEHQSGHLFCDFDDRKHDLREMADIIGVEMIYNENSDEYEFASKKDEELTSAALEYYYNLHGC